MRSERPSRPPRDSCSSRAIRRTSEPRAPSRTSRLRSWTRSSHSTGAPPQPGLERVQRLLPRRVDEDPVDGGHGVVAGGAGGGPRGGQVLSGLQDLLDQHVGAAGEAGQVVEVAPRVTQPVGVVDPQPVDQAVVEPAGDLLVGPGEPLGVLHPDRGQRVDREEPPVVEVGVGPAPRHQLVVLAGVHLVGVRLRGPGRPSREPAGSGCRGRAVRHRPRRGWRSCHPATGRRRRRRGSATDRRRPPSRCRKRRRRRSLGRG